ncbi:MAG TPA: LarC family nickel insertion protein [Burkholderiales bacterium]|nr:LarC family nickel insertion protein [Burkholderiales bacterium]
MHIHLDAVGGVAGDMFIASILDAFPDLREGMLQAIRAAGLPPDVGLSVVEHRDDALTGLRFLVDEGPHRGAAVHRHTAYREIRARLQRAPLEAAVREHAIGIFSLLAEAESKVHGVPADEVSFHELGEWDSIADIAGAAYLIAQLDATWSVGPLPQGRGGVKTAHGWLPVPTPAATLLLEGFELIDDGIVGERVTPTGAAILRHLKADGGGDRRSRRLMRAGTGFGTKSFPGLSNVLRLLAFEEAKVATESDRVAQLLFEVDDQTAEDLAIGLDRLRAHPSVRDALQMPAFGKKGRLVTHVQILCDPADLENVIEACFSETATLGVRYQVLERRKLSRSQRAVEAGGRSVRVKLARRPRARTAKAEADDLRGVSGRAERERLRREAESSALDGED